MRRSMLLAVIALVGTTWCLPSAQAGPFRRIWERRKSELKSELSSELQAEAQAPLAYADALGRAVAKKLADDGAVELIQSILAEQ